MKNSKYIVDTTMRDGEQSPGFAMTKEQKLKIAMLLDSASFYQIEAGIPSLGKYEQDTIYTIMQNRKESKISVWNRMNEKDIQMSFECCPDIIHVSIPVSYAQIYTKLKKNKVWLQKNALSCVELALSKGYEVTVGFEDASRADITFMVTLAEQLKAIGIKRIRFADTVGIMTPSRFEQTIEDFIKFTGLEIEIHAHNDLGMAVANSIVGAKQGAMFIDTTIKGIGERAGNCDFRKFVYTAEQIFDLNVNLFNALCIEEEVWNILGNPY